MRESKVVIEGVGKDAEIEVNEKGGKGSKTPAALHLIDPEFIKRNALIEYCRIDDKEKAALCLCDAMTEVAQYMLTRDSDVLYRAIAILEDNPIYCLFTIGKVLKEGAEKYEINNWRLVPREIHINHALVHLSAALAGDTQDNHREHALCRLMMATATMESPNFSYTEYIKA